MLTYKTNPTRISSLFSGVLRHLTLMPSSLNSNTSLVGKPPWCTTTFQHQQVFSRSQLINTRTGNSLHSANFHIKSCSLQPFDKSAAKPRQCQKKRTIQGINTQNSVCIGGASKQTFSVQSHASGLKENLENVIQFAQIWILGPIKLQH